MTDTDLGYHAAYYRKSFAVEKIMIERYGDGGNTDISKGLSPFPLRKPAGLAILEVTERCNLTCPMCYAYSSPSERDYSLAEIETRLDQLIAVEGKGISLQISGGEPSVRKDLDEIAAMVKHKGFGQLEMVSNGIRLAREPEFAEKLVEWGFTSGCGHQSDENNASFSIIDAIGYNEQQEINQQGSAIDGREHRSARHQRYNKL